MPKKKKILVVDDETAIQESLQGILESQGYAVEVTNSGYQCLSKIKENEYNLLILDLKIPDIDGFEILKKVSDSRPDLNIIIITGFGNLEVAKDVLTHGAAYYFDKPIDLNRFIDRVNRLLS